LTGLQLRALKGKHEAEFAIPAGKSTMLERVAGIEPAYSAWKAAALPLSYTRTPFHYRLVEEVGFEPT
jgi:hypothetical protein